MTKRRAAKKPSKRSEPAGTAASPSGLAISSVTATASGTGTPRGRGRPSTYDPAYCERILEYFSREPWTEHERTITRKDGTTIEEMVRLPVELPTMAGFACMIGVHRETLLNWQREHPDFFDACKRAKEDQERILIANGLTGLYEGAFGIFTAKNVLGWRDKVDLEHAGPGGGPIRTESRQLNPDEEYTAMVRAGGG